MQVQNGNLGDTSSASHHRASAFPVVVAAIVDLLDTLPPFAPSSLASSAPARFLHTLGLCEHLQRRASVLRILRSHQQSRHPRAGPQNFPPAQFTHGCR
jgi:hypothetical protein